MATKSETLAVRDGGNGRLVIDTSEENVWFVLGSDGLSFHHDAGHSQISLAEACELARLILNGETVWGNPATDPALFDGEVR